MDFVHLHVHSHYSFDEGVASPEALVRRARDLGMRALALTDNASLGGMVAFCLACDKYSIQPILGAEFHVLPLDARVHSGDAFKIVLLAETEIGYRNLVRLVQRAHAAPIHGKPVLRMDDLRGNGAGLIALAGGVESELHHLAGASSQAESEVHVERLVSVFGEDGVVIEVQDFGSHKHSLTAQALARLAEHKRLRCVATNDVCYIRPEDSICHEFLRSESPPNQFDFKVRRDPLKWRYMAAPTEMMKRFAGMPQAIRNSVDIAERCQFRPNFARKRFPTHDFVRGFDADSYLWDLTFREARSRFTELPAEMKARLNEEFDHIRTEGLSNNILLLWNVAQFCRNRRITMGVGRGNLISSLVAHILGITQINPLEYKLRFLGFADPDGSGHCLTLEIPSTYAPDLHDFLRETFGENFCAASGKYQMATKSQLAREVCAWFHIPPAAVAETIESLDEKTPASEVSLERLFIGKQDGINLPHPGMVKFMLARLMPRPRMLVPADGHFAISGENLSGLVPRIEVEGEPAAQFDSEAFDALNVPRLRLESSGLLNVLDAAARWVRHQENANFDADRIPLDDEDTYALLSLGDTSGIDPFHSIAMKSLLREHRPKNFMGLVRVKSMERGRDGTASGDVRDHVPECLLTYRCAFIKSHYPLSFAAAMLSHTHRNRKKFTVVLRETKQRGIRILPPDINRSQFEFSIVPKAIRTGLMVVSGMGEKAYREIERVRKGGDFSGLFDFIRRTDARLINSRLLGNLARVGAFDEFGLKRSQLLALIDEHAGTARRDSVSPSLFDQGDDEEHAGPEPPEIPELPESEIIRQEIAAAGYCISFDQLHYYRDLVEKCRAISPYSLNARLVGKEVHLAGFAEASETRTPMAEEGDQVLIDMEGRVVTMSQKLARFYHMALEANAPVLVSGTVHRRKDEVFVKARTAFTLKMVQHMSREVTAVTVALNGENLRTVRLLKQLASRYRGGETVIKARNLPGAGLAKWYASRLNGARVLFSPPYYYALKMILSEESIGLEVSDDMDADTLHLLSPARFPGVTPPVAGGEAEENSAVVDAY